MSLIENFSPPPLIFGEDWTATPIQSGLAIFFCLTILSIFTTLFYRLYLHPLANFLGRKLHVMTSLPEQWKSNVTGIWVREMAGLHRKYGPIVRIGPNHLALDGNIGWPQVYAHHPGKPEFSKYPNFLFPNDTISVLAAQKGDHRRQRRQLAHAFSDAALVEQEGIITQYVDLLITQLMKHAEASKSVDIVSCVNFTTFDIIGDLTFADAFGSLKDNSYHPWVLNFFKGVQGNALSRLMDFYPLLKSLISLFIGSDSIRRHEENTQMSVEKAKARMALGEQPVEGRRDFMTYMPKKTRDGEKGMTDIEILVNSPVLIGAGSETTAAALSGFFFYLGHHQRVYELLAKEIRDAFADEGDITMRSSRRLEYLHACIEETLRIYPPAAETPPRICPGAEIDGKYVAKGNFADPDSYRPERWLPKTHPLYDPMFANDNQAVFKPFSYGARDCIGKNLAYSEMRVVISRILYRFNFELEPGQLNWHQEQTTFLIWNKGPLNISLKLRQKE
ncbi:hypothetical protein CEP54_006265 [Fusarium duplospermum]|uniref:Cytochrome P450 monooxygenase n=1 Tax=Fusarium duplospermum TaxID=1325734 RepID=A0A428Q833_9HYPO|nr:hypothetical protein CEP54_006265 [Fusarium duplospermum]